MINLDLGYHNINLVTVTEQIHDKPLAPDTSGLARSFSCYFCGERTTFSGIARINSVRVAVNRDTIGEIVTARGKS